MRIRHDADRCASTGMCEASAPEVFRIGAEGELHILDPAPPEAARALIVEAVAACPTAALRLEG
jgi:ferredoxin